MKPLVYILVLNYCSLEDTLDCLECVRRLDYPNHRLLVLDNASPDGSGAVLSAQLPGEEFIQLITNTGYAGGNNAGMRLALARGADYVLIINPDVRLSPDSVDCYVSIMERDQTVGALTGIQVKADGMTIDSNFRIGVLRPLGLDAERLDDRTFPELIESKMLFGAALMIPARTIRRVGGFDPLYFCYGEEVDLCRRMLFHGFRLLLTSKAPFVHLRTVEKSVISDFGIFLRVKGYYLSELKAPNVSMLLTLRQIMGDLLAAMLGHPRPKFPFSHFPVKPRHAARAAIWLLWNFVAARRHRDQEKRGRCYV